jgi:hypothetical protein
MPLRAEWGNRRKNMPQKQLIRRAVALEMEIFIRHLATAREVWRRFPDLVQAEKLPAVFESAAEKNEVDLHGEYEPAADFAKPDFKRQLWRYCRNELIGVDTEEEAPAKEEHVNDEDFLRSMGIEPEIDGSDGTA